MSVHPISATTHKRAVHGATKAAYPLCIYASDFVQGTTIEQWAAVNCAQCRRMGGQP